MKLTIFLTLIGFLHVNAALRSQTITLRANNLSMNDALDIIRKQTEFGVAGQKDVISICRPVSVNVRNIQLEDFLDLIFDGQPAGYDIRGKTVFVMDRGKADDTAMVPVQQDTVALRGGTVLDTLGLPLGGVSVRVLGTSRGTMTSANGQFSIQVSATDSLVLSRVGYAAKTIGIGRHGSILVQLSAAANTALSEVVVIGYGTQRRQDLTGAVSSIKAEELPTSASTSVEQMLAGKAAGMQVRASDAQPGGGVEVLIRGATSTGAGNEPLYIIDGFPVSGGVDPSTNTRYGIGSRSPLNSINANDIESIEVLKDASATSIYGARAANGVILITTKSGKKGKTVVNYDVKGSNQHILRPFNLLDASQWMAAREDYVYERWLANNALAPYGTTDPGSVAPYSPLYSAAAIAGAGAGTDWIGEVTQTGKIQDHNLSVTGGNDKTTLLVSGNYFDQSGVVQKNDFKRFAGRLNLTHNVYDWASVGVKATGSHIRINNPALATGIAENSGILESAMRFSPTLPVRMDNGDFSFVPNSAYFPNPVSLLDIHNQTNQHRMLLQSFVEIIPFKHFRIRSQFGVDKQEGTNDIYLPITTIYGAAEGGRASINQANRFDQLFNTTIGYRREFASSHHLDALVGYEWQSMGTSGHSLVNNRFSTDAFLTNNIGAGQGERPAVGSYRGVNELASYFARVNYNFRSRYYLTATMRADGSSRFGKDNRFGYFPSASIAWRFTDYPIMERLSWLSDGKVRVSAGQTGNSNISGAFAFYAFGQDYLFGSHVNSGAYMSSYANPQLRWETTTEYNVGLDLALVHNRILITAEWFSKEVSDLLGQQQLKTYLPLDNVAANIGKTSSKGFEVTLNTQNTTGPLKWNSTFVASAYRDRWKERSPDAILASYEGPNDRLRVHWGYVLDGLVQPGETIPHMPGALTGTQKIRDINGYDQNNRLTGQPDGIINDADVVKLANQDPSLNVGFSNTFTYRQFDLNVHAYGLFGIMKWNSYMEFATTLHSDINQGMNMPDFLPLFWSSKNPDAGYPNMSVTNPFPGARQFLLQKADFVRIRNITLGYTLRKPIRSVAFLDHIRVFVDASNPILFTEFKGVDPEYATAYPAARSYTIGLTVQL